MKVLTVGCSFTFGEELPDPQSQSWPAVLADKNNWTVTNLGKCGGSNDRTVRVVVDELSNNYDLIIVAWTVSDRFEISRFNNDGKVARLSTVDVSVTRAQKDINWAVDYYIKHGDRFYHYQKWLRQIILLQSYLKQNNQKYIFCSTFGIMSDLQSALYNEYMSELEHLVKQVDATYYVEWPKMGMLDWMGDCPKGPGGHPLELGHQRIAEKINEYIRNIGWLS